MDIPESKVHSFIVKLWLEDAGDETGSAVWRGHVTHVPSGKRRYLRKLEDIVSVVESYVAEIGGDSARGSRDRRWLKPWARRER